MTNGIDNIPVCDRKILHGAAAERYLQNRGMSSSPPQSALDFFLQDMRDLSNGQVSETRQDHCSKRFLKSL